MENSRDEARKLIEKFRGVTTYEDSYGETQDSGKECALICVEKIISVLSNVGGVNSSFEKKWWFGIKEQIEKNG